MSKMIDRLINSGMFDFKSEVPDPREQGKKLSLNRLGKKTRRMWKRYRVIPLPILRYLFSLGLLPAFPKKEMVWESFVDWLLFGPHDSTEASESSRWFYEDIVRRECIPREGFPSREMYIKCDDETFMTRQQIRDNCPGAMI